MSLPEATKWAPGPYGPILSQTDLYLLQPKLQINPVLQHAKREYRLIFNLRSGETHCNPNGEDRMVAFTAKDEMATLPRVTELILICRRTPWCTIVKNPKGVSMQDVCATLWKDYADNGITEAEFTSQQTRVQEAIKKAALHRTTGNSWAGAWQQPSIALNQLRRVDWMASRFFFDGIVRDESFAKDRLGFSAPNVLVFDVVD